MTALDFFDGLLFYAALAGVCAAAFAVTFEILFPVKVEHDDNGDGTDLTPGGR